jgi:acyl carrier protein
MNSETVERTIAVIAKFKNIPNENITVETALNDLGMDSLDGLNLIFELEEEFDILIPDDEALTMKSVGEMVSGIEHLLNSKNQKENAAGEGEIRQQTAEGN